MALLDRNTVETAGNNPLDSSFSLEVSLGQVCRFSAPCLIVHRFVGSKDCYTWTSLVDLDRRQSIGAPVASWNPDTRQFEPVRHCNEIELEIIRACNTEIAEQAGQPALKVVA